jgi:uncharacterized protein (UPF0264 family)
MSTPEEQNAIELETVAIDHHLEMGEALNRLRDNPDFKKVILDGYCNQKALASVSLLAVPQVKKAGERTDVMEDLISISNLQFFFSQVDNFYEGAKNPVLSDDEEAELEAGE